MQPKLLMDTLTQFYPLFRRPDRPAVMAFDRIASQRPRIEYREVAYLLVDVGGMDTLDDLDVEITEDVPADGIVRKPILKPDTLLECPVGDKSDIFLHVKLVHAIFDVVIRAVGMNARAVGLDGEGLHINGVDEAESPDEVEGAGVYLVLGADEIDFDGAAGIELVAYRL